MMQSSPIEQPIPSTAASTIQRFPIEQWDPIVNGAYFDVSFRRWQGCNRLSSPINVYFWIWTGAKSALIVTPSAIKQRPSGISREDGIWMVDERLIIFRVDVKMYLSMLNVTSGLYISSTTRDSNVYWDLWRNVYFQNWGAELEIFITIRSVA